jgi:hypothetical protein
VPPLKEGISNWSRVYLVNYVYNLCFLDIACYLLDRFYNKRHCLTYREKTTEEKRKNTFDEDEEVVDYENENTISRSSSIR